MAETRINLDGVILSGEQLSNIILKIDKVQRNIRAISGQLDPNVLIRNDLYLRLQNQVNTLAALEEKLKQLKRVTEQGAYNYKAVDDFLTGNTINCDISDNLAEFIYSLKIKEENTG